MKSPISKAIKKKSDPQEAEDRHTSRRMKALKMTHKILD